MKRPRSFRTRRKEGAAVTVVFEAATSVFAVATEEVAVAVVAVATAAAETVVAAACAAVTTSGVAGDGAAAEAAGRDKCQGSPWTSGGALVGGREPFLPPRWISSNLRERAFPSSTSSG